MPKDFLQGASLKKSPHDVQTKGGGQRPFEQCSKKLHFSLMTASLNLIEQFENEKADRASLISFLRARVPGPTWGRSDLTKYLK